MDSGHPFDYSRNPLDFFHLEDNSKAENDWFLRNGARSMGEFIRRLRSSPKIRDAQIQVSDRRRNDQLGKDFVGFAAIRIKFKNGREVLTMGQSAGTASRAEALAIALAESLERLGCCIMEHIQYTADDEAFLTRPLIAALSSNGASFHSAPSKTLKGAFLELLERDAFLTNWYSDSELPVTKIDHAHDLAGYKKIFHRMGWQLREHAWRHDRVKAFCVSLSVIREEPIRGQWNFVLGGGAAMTLREARSKALVEALRGFRSLADFPPIDPSRKLRPADLRIAQSRRTLYQGVDYIRLFLDRLGKERKFVSDEVDRRSDMDFISEWMRKLKSTRVIPLILPSNIRNHTYCIKVTCDELQDCDWEIPPGFNRERIRLRYGTAKNRVNLVPHPIE